MQLLIENEVLLKGFQNLATDRESLTYKTQINSKLCKLSVLLMNWIYTENLDVLTVFLASISTSHYLYQIYKKQPKQLTQPQIVISMR